MTNINLKVAHLVILLSFFGVLHAGQNRPTDKEIQMLPRYCWVMAESAHMKAKGKQYHFGAAFGIVSGHIHHYCTAQNYINRAIKETDSGQKHFYLNNALDNIDYVLSRAGTESFPIRPEIHYNRGRILAMRGNISEAISEYHSAIHYNPKYPTPYSAISDLLKEMGQVEAAKEILLAGLEHAPNSKRLQRRLDRLTE